VLVDLVRRRQITKEACMDLLRVHIKENILQVRRSAPLHPIHCGMPSMSAKPLIDR
jgi:hypothetical protein